MKPGLPSAEGTEEAQGPPDTNAQSPEPGVPGAERTPEFAEEGLFWRGWGCAEKASQRSM